MLSSSSPANLQSLRLGFRPALTRPSVPRPAISAAACRPPFLLKPRGLGFSGLRCDGRRYFLPVEAVEESAPHGVSDGEVEKNSEIELQTSKDPLKTSASSVKQHAPKYAAFREWRRRRRKLFVPLPGTLGLVHLGKGYLVLTAFCFAAMGNGVNLTDGLDGLAGGVAAWAFIAMSVTVLAICPDLAIFGASMAGACVGFLFHNRYKASVFMGDTGSLALGGALAAMASCTGMFIPLFITSGVFVMEALSVVVQVSYVKATRWLYGESKRFFRMAPVHHHFELCGFKEPIIVASAYFMSCIFALCAAYVGLILA